MLWPGQHVAVSLHIIKQRIFFVIIYLGPVFDSLQQHAVAGSWLQRPALACSCLQRRLHASIDEQMLAVDYS